jgi:hypothetical protein
MEPSRPAVPSTIMLVSYSICSRALQHEGNPNMSLSAIIDVIIGLVFTYFLLAMVASGLQELVAALFAWRGTYLSKGIDVIIDNEPNTTWNWSLGEFLKAHFTPGAPPTAADRLAQQIAGPQKGVALPGQVELQKVLSVHTHPLVRSSPTDLPSYVPARNFALALLETLHDGSQAPLFTQVERTISALPEGDLKRTLSLFLKNAGDDLGVFGNNIEHWFDDAMDRLSGIYKRISQYVMLVLGLLIAVALNVDSIRLSRTLWEEIGLRNAIVADSAIWANKGSASAPPRPSDESCIQPQTSQSTAAQKGAAGTVDVNGQQSPSATVTPSTSEPLPIGPVQAAMACFEQENLPFGWSGSAVFGVWTIPGWILTGLAIGFGAPFWFGLLQQLTNVRNSGPAPERPSAAPNGSAHQ